MSVKGWYMSCIGCETLLFLKYLFGETEIDAKCIYGHHLKGDLECLLIAEKI